MTEWSNTTPNARRYYLDLLQQSVSGKSLSSIISPPLFNPCACREEPELSSSGQPAGFQAVLRLTLHEAAVTSAALCSRAGLLALADQAGALSVVDLQRPAVLCTRQLSEQPIASLGFGVHSFRPQWGPAEKVCEPSEAPIEDR